MIDQEQHDAGFRSSQESVPATESSNVEAKAGAVDSKIVRLKEVKQLIVPVDTQLPEQLHDMQRFVTDLAELGQIIMNAEIKDDPCIILLAPDATLLAAFEYPTLFRLKAAVVRNIPGATYTPVFNQAVYGLNEVSWGYLIDALDLDDRLAFDTKGGRNESDGAGYRSIEEGVDAAESGGADV